MDVMEVTLKKETYEKTISLHYLDEGRTPSLEMANKVVSKFNEIVDILEEEKRKDKNEKTQHKKT